MVSRSPVPGHAEAREGDLLRLYCSIVVDRESQKAIVVGRGGEMVKKMVQNGQPVEYGQPLFAIRKA